MYKSQLFEPPKDNDDECDDLDAESEDSFNIMSEDDTPREITEKFKLAKIIDKIRESVKKFKYSPVKCDDILTKYLPKDKHNKTYSLIFDMKTRWSSTDLINVECGDSFENFSTAFDKKQCVEAVPIVKSDLLKEIEEMRSSNKRDALLEKVHDFLLNIQVTSVEVERSFSVAGRICTKINSRLGDESINVLSMLYAKFRAIEIAEERATQKPVEKNTAKKRNNSQAIPCPVNEDPEHGVAAKKVRGKK